MTGSGVPVVVALSRAERRLVEGLRRAGATNAGAARPLDPRGLQVGRLEKLLQAGVILEATPGAYYVDETAYQRYRQHKRMTVLAVFAALLLVALLFFAVRLMSSGRRADRSPTPGTDTPRATAPAPSSPAASLASPTGWTLSETGWGPVRAGMSVAEARVALGGSLAEPRNPRCDHVRPPSAPPGVLLMLVDGRVARVEVSDTTVATAEGARVGDTEPRINALYPGRVESAPHKYEDGHYLIVRRGAGADSVYRLVFETDGQRVTRFRGGRFPEVEWVEGCS